MNTRSERLQRGQLCSCEFVSSSSSSSSLKVCYIQQVIQQVSNIRPRSFAQLICAAGLEATRTLAGCVQAPRDKLVCILNCCRYINNLINRAAREGETRGAPAAFVEV